MTPAYVHASLDDLGVDHRPGFWGAEPEGGDGGQLVQVVRNGDIRSNGVVNATTCPVRRFTRREVQDSELKRGDVLVTTSGEPGKSAYWGGTQGFAASNFVRRLRAPDAAIGKYVFYFLRSQPSREAFARHSRGVAIKNLSRQFWDELRVPVRGVGDIAATVVAIESYLSRLDDAVASLERVQAKLKAYRASVLKAAVEGRLVPTEASLARAEKRAYDPAQALLARILRERRRRWEEAELTKLKTAGKTPKDAKWKAKYPEPVAPDTSTLPELPEGWCWATLPQLGELNRGKSKHRPRNDPRLLGGPYPFVQTGDIRKAETWLCTFEETYSDFGLAQSRLWPAGTLCITIAANIAETAILGLDACFPDSVVGFLQDEPILTRYVEMFIRTAQQRLDQYAPATAQKNINLDTLSKVAVPLPPLDEQRRMVEELDRLFSVGATIGNCVFADERRCSRLRQAVLRWAFDGKLVDQDPNDEPAEKLLARIQAERASVGPTKESRGRKARGAA